MRITNKVALWIIVIYTLIVMAVVLLPLTVNAADFSDLSDRAKEDYITSIILKNKNMKFHFLLFGGRR